MEQYIESYMSSFRNPNSDRALEYEIEYIVCGKSSDEANLKSVVNIDKCVARFYEKENFSSSYDGNFSTWNDCLRTEE